MQVFDDILDGYFPLKVSVGDLMRRRGLQHAALKISFAPIIVVDGLPPDAPIPLSIRSGRAGIIRAAHLSVSVTQGDVHLSGQARWDWLNGAPSKEELDPMTRLAEPALVHVRPQIKSPPSSEGRILYLAQAGRTGSHATAPEQSAFRSTKT